MKRTLRYLFGVVLLSMAIAATRIPVGVSEAAQENSDFKLDGTTLIKYTGTAYAVSVPDEVETIGEEAFSGNNYIKIVRLPDNLKSIEYGAFSYCNILNKISIPDSVESIGSGAFACCTSLASVEIGEGVKEMGSGVFAGCTSLKNISLDKSNTNFIMDKGALYDIDKVKLYQYCPGRKDYIYTMPDSVLDVGKYAFWGCQNLEKVVLNNNIAELSGYSFSNCRSLKTIEMPYSLSTIDVKAFEDCISLTEVTLPASIQNIHNTAFDGCINLTLYADKDSIAGEYALLFNKHERSEQAEYEDVYQTLSPSYDNSYSDNPDNDAKTDNSSFDNDKNDNIAPSDEMELESMLGSTTIVGNQAVVFIDNSKRQVYDGSDIINQNTVSDDDGIITDTSLAEEGDNPKYDGKGINIPKYKIFDGTIANQAYYRNDSLTAFQFPDDITGIGDFAFARSGLNSIIIPEGVKRIGYGAFYHCDNLNQVVLPSTIEDIEPEAFEKTGFIENWKKSGSSDFLTAGNGILLAYNGNEAIVNIPESVRIIAPGVFKNHSEINSVVLPDSLLIIGEGAFEGCTGLKQVSGGVNVLKIKDRAFAKCPLSTIRIPDDIGELGLLAFDLSGFNIRNDRRTAVFLDNIPVITYEKTAQRLSNNDYRKRVLNDVSYAVINKDIPIESLKGTVLDSAEYGFKGIIISIDSESDMTASVRATTLTLSELNDFEITDTVEIYGRQYILNGTKQLEELASDNTNESYNKGSVLILNKVNNLDTKKMSACLSENTDSFYLCIEQSTDAYERLSAKFNDIYNMNPPANFVAYDISLYEEDSNVPITKLGKQKMRITMPLPEGLESGTLFILTADADGQLEDVPYWYEESENERRVTFEVNHFSDFGLYTSGTTIYAEGIATQGKAVIGSFSQKDDSPDTGDLLHPKWFLAGGLFFAALAVIFMKKKSVNIIGK